jgi:hypothetical protein
VAQAFPDQAQLRSRTELTAAVEDLLAAAESFARAGDFTAACARARQAVREAARAAGLEREALVARASLALGRHRMALSAWQAGNANRMADEQRRETRFRPRHSAYLRGRSGTGSA